VTERRTATLLLLRRWWPAFTLYTLLRVPSFLEPHWYTDEASYVSVGRSLLQGKILYAQIWNNKPPLQSWTIAAETWLFGSSEAGLHLLTFMSGALALSAVAWVARRLMSPRRALAATLLTAMALGLPVFDAELAIPESLLIAPLSWAAALLLVRLYPPSASQPRRFRGWPVAVGALTAVAIAYQQTALAEAGAFALALMFSPKAGGRDLAAYAGTVVVLTGVWVGVAMAQAGAPAVTFALAGFYIAYTQSVFPMSTAGVILHLSEVGLAALLLVVGALLSRRQGFRSVLILWAGASLMVPAISRQPYAHYLTAAVVPVSLLLASLPAPRRLLSLSRACAARFAPEVVGLGIAGVMAASVAGLDWIPAAAPSPSLNSTRTLGMYYGGAVTAAINKDAHDDWEKSFDSRVGADQAVAEWIDGVGLAGSSAVVWSSDAWLYALADLDEQMPTPPIYNDEVLLGIKGPVADRVGALSPTLIIVADDALSQFPEVKTLLDGTRYQAVFVSAPDTVWMRGDVVASLGVPAGEALR
jgi:4-amino-4-deoxy-L-arabinose transferase-like glycosyltransferase